MFVILFFFRKSGSNSRRHWKHSYKNHWNRNRRYTSYSFNLYFSAI